MARESRRSDIETGCSALGSNRRCDAARVVGVLKSTGDCRGLKRRCSAPHACSPRGAAPPHPPMRPRATRAPPIGRFAPCHRPRGRTRPSQRQGRCASFGAATPPLDPGALGRMHQDRCPCAREHGPPTRERWPRQPQTKEPASRLPSLWGGAAAARRPSIRLRLGARCAIRPRAGGGGVRWWCRPGATVPWAGSATIDSRR